MSGSTRSGPLRVIGALSSRFTPLCAGLYLLALWADKILLANLRLGFSDGFLAITLLVAAPTMAGLWRQLVRMPLLWLSVAIAASALVSTLVSDGGVTRIQLYSVGSRVWLVILLIAATSCGRRDLARAALGMAGLFVAIAALGGLLGMFGWLDGLVSESVGPAFVAREDHPVIGDWPRLVGGLSIWAERCGLWAALSLSLMVGWAHTGVRIAWLGAVVVAVVASLTFSIYALALVAGAPVWVWSRTGSRAKTASTAVVALIVVAIAQIPIHRGPSLPATVVCEGHSPNHHARWLDVDADICHPRTFSSGAVMTRYAVAKLHSWQLFSQRPILGVGLSGYRQHTIDERYRGWRHFNPYHTTSGTYHGVLAEQGLLGAGLYLALALTLIALVRRTWHLAPAWSLSCAVLLISLAAAALDRDVHTQPIFWMVIGAVQGLGNDS